MQDRNPLTLTNYATARTWLGRRPTVDEQRLFHEIAATMSGRALPKIIQTQCVQAPNHTPSHSRPDHRFS